MILPKEAWIILLIVIVVTPLLICFLLVFFLWFQLIEIYKLTKDNPKLLSKVLMFTPFNNRFLNFWKLSEITFKQGFTFIAFSKEKYNRSFDALFNYNEITKSKNIALITKIDHYKRWSRAYLVVFNSYSSGIIAITLLSFLIALLLR